MTALAQLSFWVPPERMDEFQGSYEKKVLPVLKKHDLVESPEHGRKTPEGVFSRLFEFETPAEITVKGGAIQKDPTWKELLRSLGITFGTAGPDGLLESYFGIYRSPAGSGRTVKAGPGYCQGLWHNFGVNDGLPFSDVYEILQDCEGNLWFGFRGWGACRYDGVEFTNFTTEDGLAGNWVGSIFQDGGGNLWFGTGPPGGLPARGGLRAYGRGGVSRYDGKEFINFTTADGLATNMVTCIVEDQEGNLWFGGPGGVSRYDGKKFVNFTTEDGLTDNMVDCVNRKVKIPSLPESKSIHPGYFLPFSTTSFVGLKTALGTVPARRLSLSRYDSPLMLIVWE
jgi:hypothetical protein